ncbi:MAG: hypothetical protein VX223_08475 [Myxococcota bacterium]|nr:hypothetical protein [Myxococcota bacterium]
MGSGDMTVEFAYELKRLFTWALIPSFLACSTATSSDDIVSETSDISSPGERVDAAPPIVEYSVPENTSRTSFITLFSYGFADVSTSNVVVGLYDQSPALVRTVVWEDEQSGCKITRNEFHDRVGTPNMADAGVLSLTGGPVEVNIPFEEIGYPAYATADSVLFSGGETLTYQASGGDDIRSFSATTRAPIGATVSQPEYAPGEFLLFDRSKDLEVRWSGGQTDDQLLLKLTHLQADGGASITLQCLWPARAGQSVVPAAVLSQIPVGTSSFTLITTNRTEIIVPAWGPVGCHADTPATNKDGAAIDTEVQLE